jgi:apolipoprotein D and lipocalin family protein
MNSRLTGLLIPLAALCLFPAVSIAQGVTALPHLEVNNLTGSWYQIARYPNRREKLCVANSLELVALDDKSNRLQLVDSCTVSQGFTLVHNYIAKIDKQTDGKLKIPQFFPLSRPYWVLAMAQDNSWLVIGEGNRKELWIFSRSPKLDAATLTQIEAVTTTSGFSTSKLIFPPQTDGASLPSPPATKSR